MFDKSSLPAQLLVERKNRDITDKIKQTALGLLARREHSMYELRQKLLLRKFPLEEVQKIIEALAKDNWQSDARFAQAYFNSRVERGYGPLKIESELRNCRISDALIQQVIPKDKQFWRQQLLIVWRKKYASAPKALRPITAEYAKQVRFILSRGFCIEHI